MTVMSNTLIKSQLKDLEKKMEKKLSPAMKQKSGHLSNTNRLKKKLFYLSQLLQMQFFIRTFSPPVNSPIVAFRCGGIQ
jgi:hypothetical protein